jgi:anti-sigma B factor antagonist
MFELCLVKNDGLQCYIKLRGEIDIYTAPDFKKSLYEAIDKYDKDVIVDMQDLSYIDSTGLGILVGALRHIKENNCNMIIRNPRSTVRKLFKITGLDKVFIMEEANP